MIFQLLPKSPLAPLLQKGKLLLASLLLFALGDVSCFAMELPQENPVPGGIAILSLGNQKPQRVTYQGKPVLTLETEQGYRSVIGISLQTKPGVEKLHVLYNNQSQRDIPFTINDKRYEEQHIALENKRQVNPEKQDLERIAQETLRIRAAFSHWTAATPESLRWLPPVVAPISSPFGLKRFFNGQARKPHSGIDLAATKGREILAPTGGTVIEVGDYFFNGKTVFIQHGQGLVTMYCHMDSIAVEKGQTILRNGRIGTVGASGRATGPHLHWSVSLNDNLVDPQLFLLMQEPSHESIHEQ